MADEDNLYIQLSSISREEMQLLFSKTPEVIALMEGPDLHGWARAQFARWLSEAHAWNNHNEFDIHCRCYGVIFNNHREGNYMDAIGHLVDFLRIWLQFKNWGPPDAGLLRSHGWHIDDAEFKIGLETITS